MLQVVEVAKGPQCECVKRHSFWLVEDAAVRDENHLDYNTPGQVLRN